MWSLITSEGTEKVNPRKRSWAMLRFQIFQFLSLANTSILKSAFWLNIWIVPQRPISYPRCVAAFLAGGTNSNSANRSLALKTTQTHKNATITEPEHMQIGGLINWQLFLRYKELPFVVLHRNGTYGILEDKQQVPPSVEYDCATYTV